MKRYLVVDFMNMAFRAHYAYREQLRFTNSEGFPTGMSYGVLGMTLALVRDTHATHVVFATESQGRTLNANLVDEYARKSPSVAVAFPAGYKGGRGEMEEGLRLQLDLATKAVNAMGWAMYRSEGYEADDTLATIAKQIELHGRYDTAVIVTGDQDLWQCVSPMTSVKAPRPGNVYIDVTAETFGEFMHGLSPGQIIDYKALVGDSSDGYPGCPGIGSVGALKLLREYGTLNGIYDHIDEIKGATKTKLTAGYDLVELSQSLAQLDNAVPIEFYPDWGLVKMPYPLSAIGFVRKHGMLSLEKRLGWDGL